MGRFLTPAAMTAVMLAFTVAALSAGLATYRPSLWPAAVQLAILGGIIPMIYAVNLRIVPVFSRRMWTSPTLLQAQVVLALAGAWLGFVGAVLGLREMAVVGSAAALAGGVLFIVNLRRSFPACHSPRAPRSRARPCSC